MKIFEMTTGLIAAVVVALGANHYVNSNAPVGEEPVVEETNQVLPIPKRDCVWYLYDGANLSDPGYETEIELAQHYRLFSDEPTDMPDCNFGEQICAICLPLTSGDNPDQVALNSILDEIRDGEPHAGVVKLKPEPIDPK